MPIDKTIKALYKELKKQKIWSDDVKKFKKNYKKYIIQSGSNNYNDASEIFKMIQAYKEMPKQSSVKRTSAKRSGAKRSSKRSAKRSGVKRSSKRSGVKRSSKRSGVKRSSVKRSAKRSAKRSGVKRSSKKSAKRSAKKSGVKRSSKKSAKRSSAKRSGVKRSAKKSGVKRRSQKGSGLFKSKQPTLKKQESFQDIFRGTAVSELNSDNLMKCQDELKVVQSQLESCKQTHVKSNVVSELLTNPLFKKQQTGKGLFSRSNSKKVKTSELDTYISSPDSGIFSAISKPESEDALQKYNVSLEEYKSKLHDADQQIRTSKQQMDECNENLEHILDENEMLKTSVQQLEDERDDFVYNTGVYGLDWANIIDLVDTYEARIEALQNENKMLQEKI